MRRDCPETCRQYLRDARSGDDDGYSDEDDSCYDERDDCKQWDRNFNFCDSEWYTDDDKEDFCAYTCGFC
jgi:ShK domain-like